MSKILIIRIHDTGDCDIPAYILLSKNIFKYDMTYWNQYAVCGIGRLKPCSAKCLRTEF
jgi:hypothetical protein